MALGPRSRQKKLEKKAAKRKAVHAKKKASHAEGISLLKQIELASKSPIHECLAPETIFETGIGHVIVSRELPNGDIAAGFFLVDVYCLGIKSAFFQVMPESEFRRKVGGVSSVDKLGEVDPSFARKLLEGAEAYAAQIGLEPHPDYRLAEKIFGDIDAAACPAEFTFGYNDKPLFMQGPHDTPAKCRKIMDTLSGRLGPDGFDYILSWKERFPDEFQELED